jgi:hypothetical protein
MIASGDAEMVEMMMLMVLVVGIGTSRKAPEIVVRGLYKQRLNLNAPLTRGT